MLMLMVVMIAFLPDEMRAVSMVWSQGIDIS